MDQNSAFLKYKTNHHLNNYSTIIHQLLKLVVHLASLCCIYQYMKLYNHIIVVHKLFELVVI